VLRRPWSARTALLPPRTDRQLGEAYLHDDLDVEGSMVAAIADLAARRAQLERPGLRAALLAELLRLPTPPARAEVGRTARLTGRAHSRHRDQVAVQHHYDVSNDLYRLFLDGDLVYSCAYFHPDDPRHPRGAGDDTLERAQARKLELICRKLHLGPGDRLLDIGCGWGSLLIHAARHHGVRGVGVTLSQRQVELARERIEAAGLADRVEIRLQDYREVSGRFDAVASVGMFEHVGAEHLADYFTTCHRLTRPGGRFLNHGITTGRGNLVRDLAGDPDSFMARYVFPDGALVPAHLAVTHVERAGFDLLDLEQLRPHYARTLDHWVTRLEANADAARRVAGEPVYRTWRAYMAGSAAAFDRGDLGVVQVLATRGDVDLPLGRAWMLPDADPSDPAPGPGAASGRSRAASGPDEYGGGR